jgi:hypothetical protein
MLDLRYDPYRLRAARSSSAPEHRLAEGGLK